MTISRLTQRKVKAIGYYLSSWLVLSMIFCAGQQYGSHQPFNLHLFFFVLQLSLFMGLSHGFYDILILQDEMDRRAVGQALFIRSMFFISCICGNIIICLLLWNLKGNEGLINESSLSNTLQAFRQPDTQVLVITLFIFGHLITFIRSVHKKFGTRVFTNTILGKTQDPIEEDRVFMFIDLKQSTTIAEELGHVKYSTFLKDYYKLLTNCCEENHGEIYQFAGDGVFLTWKTKSCQKATRPLNMFYDFAKCLEGTRHKFLRRYGISPSFKAAAHCGKVITTEVGNFGSEMAYHGDVLNTTSRIQALCAKLGKDLLVSEEMLKHFTQPLSHGFTCEKEGFFELKGKKNGILIYSINQPLTSSQNNSIIGETSRE